MRPAAAVAGGAARGAGLVRVTANSALRCGGSPRVSRAPVACSFPLMSLNVRALAVHRSRTPTRDEDGFKIGEPEEPARGFRHPGKVRKGSGGRGTNERLRNEQILRAYGEFEKVRMVREKSSGEPSEIVTVGRALEIWRQETQNGKWFMDYNLVVIDGNSTPPVVKIDTTYRVDEGTGEPLVHDRAARNKQKADRANKLKKTKSMSFRATIAEGDVQVKCDKIHKMLSKNHPVVVRIDFTAKLRYDRIMALAMLRNFVERVSDVGWPTVPTRRDFSAQVTLSPLKKPKSEAEWDVLWEKFVLPIVYNEDGEEI
jgi:translation initiation factor IF-3